MLLLSPMSNAQTIQQRIKLAETQLIELATTPGTLLCQERRWTS